MTSKLEDKHTLIALWPGLFPSLSTLQTNNFWFCILSALHCGLRKAPSILYDGFFQRETELVPVVGDVSVM